MERAFFLLTTEDVDCNGVSHEKSTLKLFNPRDGRWNLPEIQKFLATAETGDVFQIQHDEYILALGNLIKASWLR